MRLRRYFSPVVDGLPSRIAPSAMAGLTLVAHVSVSAPQSQVPLLGGHLSDDTDPPMGGSSGPIIIAPVGNSPSSLPC